MQLHPTWSLQHRHCRREARAKARPSSIVHTVKDRPSWRIDSSTVDMSTCMVEKQSIMICEQQTKQVVY